MVMNHTVGTGIRITGVVALELVDEVPIMSGIDCLSPRVIERRQWPELKPCCAAIEP